MTSEYCNDESYLDYEIRTRVFGPVKTNPQDSNCQMAHYLATVTVFQNGSEIDGARTALQGQYADQYLAENSAFARGRETVNRILAL